jgi:hypothetical protein
MSFRINKGVFQFKDTVSDTFINKFKIDDRGEMVEVDADGNKITAYMRLGDKAHDADLLDGVDSSAFIRSNTADTFTGSLTMGTQQALKASNYGHGVYGVYSSTRYQHVWGMGTSWHMDAGGSNLGNFYGLAYTHTNIGGESKPGLSHQTLFVEAGIVKTAIGRGIWTDGTITTTVHGTSANWNTAYGWGNHAGLYDAAGSADAVNLRIEEEILPAIDSKLDATATAVNADTVDGYHATNAGGGIPVLNANGYWDAPSWINVRGTGLYSSTANGAHFVPNPHSYGSWQITGTRGGWVGLHFGAGSGVTLMMNESESGIHREGSGWKYRHTGGKFYVHTGTNGGGTGYPVWHEGNLTPISYATGSFTVGGDPETYYPVMLNKSSRTTGRFVIYRDNVHQNETNRGAGRLVLSGYTSGWGHVPLTLHYETKISGTVLWKFLASNYRTGLMVVYLKGATTYYYKSEHGFTLYDANGSGEQKSDGRTNWLPTPQDDSNASWEGESPSVLTIEHGVSYYDGTLKAGRFKGDGTDITNVNAETLDGIDSSGFLRSTAKAADSNLLDGIDSSSFLRSDANDTMSGTLTLKYSTADSDDYHALDFAPSSNDYIIKASSSRGAFGRKSFGWHIDTASAFGVYSNGWTKLFGVEGGTGNAFATGTFNAGALTVSGSTNNARIVADSAGMKIQNDNGEIHFGPLNSSWAHIYTDRPAFYTNKPIYENNARLATQAYASSSADAVRTDLSELISTAQDTADGATTLARAAQTTADGKLGATAKAADSNLLDGIDSSAFIRENQDRRHKVIRFTGESGDSGNGVINYGIYQEGGAWTHPYPDLVIGMHTGIKIGGYKNYGGTRFYNDAPGRSGAVELFSVGNGDNNIRVANNLHIGSAGGWITDLLNAKETAGAAAAVNTALSEEIGNLATAVTDNTTQISNNRTEITGKLGSSEKAANSHAADGVNIVGYGTGEFSFNQGSGTFAGHSGWANYFIGNHGSGSSYYNTTHIMPFWGPPQYSRLESGTLRGPYTYWTTENFDPATKANVSHDHNDLYYTKAQSNANYDSAGSASTAQTNATNAANDRIDNEVMPQVTTNATNIARNATDIASKLGTTGKAADADKLDGYDWMQSGKSVRANEFYADNWFRNYNSNEGMYNQATGQHWYSDDDDYWNVAGGSGANGIRFRDEHSGTIRGYVYADNSNRIGLLDEGGSWAIRHDNNSGTYFYTDNETLEFRVGRDVVTGTYGTVQTVTTRAGWGGYSINGQYVFMSDHASNCGIFNDIDNEWMAIFRRNAGVELMYNGAMKLETTSTGVSVTGTVTATAFSGSLDWANVTNKPVIPVATEPIQATVEGGNNSTLASIAFSPGEGAATFTLADGQIFRLAFAR